MTHPLVGGMGQAITNPVSSRPAYDGFIPRAASPAQQDPQPQHDNLALAENPKFERFISRPDKATWAGGWIVPDDWRGVIPPHVLAAVVALEPDDAYQVLGNNEAAVVEAARRLRAMLRPDVAAGGGLTVNPLPPIVGVAPVRRQRLIAALIEIVCGHRGLLPGRIKPGAGP